MSVRQSTMYIHSRTYACNGNVPMCRGTSILVKIVVMHVSEEIIAEITLDYWKQRFTTNAKRDISIYTTNKYDSSRRILTTYRGFSCFNRTLKTYDLQR